MPAGAAVRRLTILPPCDDCVRSVTDALGSVPGVITPLIEEAVRVARLSRAERLAIALDRGDAGSASVALSSTPIRRPTRP
jgi:hypothetical protein